MPSKKLQIFVSSTFLDLKDERQAAVAAILKAGHIPAGMELFTAGDESQWQTITRWIDESDIYMLILGGRYGTQNPKTGVGYTEMEYDYALERKKPFFAVVIEDVALTQQERVSNGSSEINDCEKLAAFRKKVLEHTSSFFSDAKDIKLAVHETVPVLEQRYSLHGWISGAEFSNNKPLVEEIARLTEDNRRLGAEVEDLQNKLVGQSKNRPNDFAALGRALAQISQDIPPIPELSNLGPRESVLALLLLFKEKLFYGVTNSALASEAEVFVFQSLGPTLAIHDLLKLNDVPDVRWKRYTLTPRGKKFLAFLDLQYPEARGNESESEPKKVGPSYMASPSPKA